jgi:cytidylate kinase
MIDDVKRAIAGKNISIAVSGKSGCGNTTLSRMLAESLELEFINYTFRSLAVERGVELDDIIAQAARSDEIDRYVDQRQVEMASEGNCVLASRLAIWLKKDADISIYLYADPEVRISRIAKREGWSYEKAEAHTMMRDREDHSRYLELYGIDNDDYRFADLILDSGKLSPAEELDQVLSTLLEKFGKTGLN